MFRYLPRVGDFVNLYRSSGGMLYPTEVSNVMKTPGHYQIELRLRITADDLPRRDYKSASLSLKQRPDKGR